MDIRNGGLGKIEYGYAVWNGTNLQHTSVKGIWKAPRQYSELRERVTSVKVVGPGKLVYKQQNSFEMSHLRCEIFLIVVLFYARHLVKIIALINALY